MLGFAKKSPEHSEALDRVREWTRARFKLLSEAAILVSELACTLPGCPPLETVVAFWTAGDPPSLRFGGRVSKPAIALATAGDPPSLRFGGRVSKPAIALATAGDQRHHFKIFKPVAAVVEDDLPPAWMKNALAVPEGVDCECC